MERGKAVLTTMRMAVRPTETHTAMMMVVDWELDDDELELGTLSLQGFAGN